jgi:hypothetical protein
MIEQVPVGEGTYPMSGLPTNLIADDLENFRSNWRKEIQKGQPTQDLEIETQPAKSQAVTPLEIYENAILKEGQGSLSEAVLQYRKAFKVDLFFCT